MSAKSAGSRFALKLLLGVAVVAAVGVVVFVRSRAVAKVSVVYAGPASNSVPGSVVVRAGYDQALVSEAAGRVIEKDFNLDPGKKVKKGDVLCRIDPTDLLIDIEHTESEFTAAKKRLSIGSSLELDRQTAEEALNNDERLFKAGGVSSTEIAVKRRAYAAVVQKVENEKVTNQLTIDKFENELKIRRRTLEKMTITAQFDGEVSEVFVHPGALINANTSLATLITIGRAVEAKISQENFAGIRLGQKAIVRFLGHADEIYDATIIKILPTAEADTQRNIVHLDVEVKGNAGLLKPGLTGEVSIIIGQRAAEALVPRRALKGNTVLVVEDGRVKRREVVPGYVSLNLVEILKGLKAGEQVIVEDQDLFRENVRVGVEVVKAQ